MPLLILLFVILLAVLFYTVGIYNRLVALRQKYRNGFAQIDVQLKRRHDLIPNLVETAKGYLKHERDTLDAVVAARGAAQNARRAAAAQPGNTDLMSGLAGAEALLGGAMSRLLAVVENYPDLKADRTMAQLSEELTTTENKIGTARQAYNHTVMGYNTAIEQFPGNLVAAQFRFTPAALLEFSESRAAGVPEVDFS